MKSSLSLILGSILAVLLFSGCIRYHYDGKELPVTDKKAEVFWKKVEIVRPYEVMGNAEVWGNYQDCTRGSLLEKLEEKAAAAGADAVLVTNYAVTTSEQRSAGNNAFTSSFDTDDSGNGNWKMIERDVDLTYGNARGRGGNAASIQTIRRVMKAEYLHYTSQAAGKSAEEVKNAASAPKETKAKKSSSRKRKRQMVKVEVNEKGAPAKTEQPAETAPQAAPLPITADPKVNPAKPGNQAGEK